MRMPGNLRAATTYEEVEIASVVGLQYVLDIQLLVSAAIDRGRRVPELLQMPMMGLPWNSWSGMPWFFIQLRYMKPFLSAVPNHSAERSFLRSGMSSPEGAALDRGVSSSSETTGISDIDPMSCCARGIWISA